MTIELRPVTIENWRAVIDLRVASGQEGFVSSNVYSLAESKFGFEYQGRWELFPRAIYADEMLVGFFMHGLNFNCQKFECLILRLMIAGPYQKRGYGRSATQVVLKEFEQDQRITKIGISYNPDNHVVQRFYTSLGFVETGEIFDEELLAIHQKKIQ